MTDVIFWCTAGFKRPNAFASDRQPWIVDLAAIVIVSHQFGFTIHIRIVIFTPSCNSNGQRYVRADQKKRSFPSAEGCLAMASGLRVEHRGVGRYLWERDKCR